MNYTAIVSLFWHGVIRRDAECPCVIKGVVLASLAAISMLLSPQIGDADTAAIFPNSEINGPQVIAPAESIVFGWEFTVSTPMDITQLGWFDLSANGLADAHEVAIWDTTGAALTSVEIVGGNASAIDGGFRYEAISPIRLIPGGVYTIAGVVPRYRCDPIQPGCYEMPPSVEEGTEFIFDISLLHSTALPSSIEISVLRGLFSTLDSDQLTRPINEIDGNGIYIGPNFQFAAVPEPTSTVIGGMALISIALVRRLRRR